MRSSGAPLGMPGTLGRVGESSEKSLLDSALIKWEVEEPSEFRPGLDNIGKDKESFRAFYDVSYKHGKNWLLSPPDRAKVINLC